MPTLPSMMRRFVLLLAVGVWVAGRAAEPVDVFFLCGASNASGRLNQAYVEEPVDREVLYFHDTDGPSGTDFTTTNWTSLKPLPTGYYGAEISIGRHLSAFGYRPALIKISHGGSTSLGVDWNSRTPGDWWMRWEQATTGALAQLHATGRSVRVRGFFWMQGESDALVGSRAAAYRTNFTHLMADVRDALDSMGHPADDLRFVAGLIRTVNAHSGPVREALLSSADCVETDDLTVFDGVHYDDHSVRILAHRFVDTLHAGLLPPISLAGDRVHLRWRSKIGTTYTIHRSEDLVSWVESVRPPAVSSLTLLELEGRTPFEFYRVSGPAGSPPSSF